MSSVLVESSLAVDYDPFAGGELSRVVPSTEPQREVWLASQLGVDASLAFNESVSLRLRGVLDADALAVALSGVVDAHDALHAGFSPDGETFCVLAPGAFALERSDLSALDPAAREAALAARLQASVDTPFDLAAGHLFRAELVRLAADEHVLLMSAHHIVCDGWSWWVIVRELGARYARARGEVAVEVPAPVAFADYAVAEAARGAGDAQLAADAAYWTQRFADGVPVLELPVDRPRPARRSFGAGREDVVLDAALVSSVRRLGARQGASLFAT